MRRLFVALLFTCALAVIFSGCSGGSEGCANATDCARGEMCVSGQCLSAAPKNDDASTDQDALIFPDAVSVDLGVSDPDTGAVDPDGGSFPDVSGDPDAVVFADATPGDAFAPDAVIDPDGAVFPDALPGDTGNGCTADNQCGTPPINVCENNTCVLGCGQAGGLSCTGNEVCDTNTGHCVPVVTSCTMDSQCVPAPPARVCESMQCVPGCGQAGGLVCSGATPRCNATTGRCEPPPPCTLDSECMNADLICLNSACVLRCDRTGAAPCVSGSVCNPGTGRCVPGNLPLGSDCTFDAQCQSALCLGLTIGGMNRNVCSQPCGASSNCPLQFSCLYLSGMNFCLGENLFTPPASFDVAAGGACSSGNISCQSGWCNTQLLQCIETCSRASDCAGFGGNCWTYTQSGGANNTYDHLCLAQTGQPIGNVCLTNNGCQSGICSRYTNTCAAHCCRDSDCPATQVCGLYDLDVAAGTLVKVCGPRTPGAGNQTIGATCTQSTECDSEVCAVRSLSQPNGPMQCSTFCCNHADCSVLPNGRCVPFDGPVIGTQQTIVGVCVNG